jgi:protein ImuB
MKRILCIWLPDWPRQCRTIALSRRPEQSEKWERDRPEANELLARMAEREALEALAASCDCFSPAVGVETSPNPESLLLDITGLVHLFGGEAALARRIVGELARRGLRVHVAIADTVGAAWAMAHFCGAGVSPAHFRGRRDACTTIETGETTICVVPPGKTAAALWPLPIAFLRLTDEVVSLFHQLGIERIEQLEMLPRDELGARFGPEVLRRLDQAMGRLAEPVVAYQPSPAFEAGWTLEHPTRRRETVEQILEHLIARVAAMLIQRGCGALRLECRLECPPQNAVRLGLGLFESTAAVKQLLELVQLQLERLRIAAPVAAVYVGATITAPLEYRQQEFFVEDSMRQRPRQLAGLVNRLSSRLGPRAVARVRLKADAQPELAWQYDPLIDGAVKRRIRRREAFRDADLPPRPLRLFARPQRLAATSISPDGPPVRFQFGGEEHQVAHTWGPERIETGWWRGQIVGRNYFRVETIVGRRFWLYRRLRDGSWFLRGIFE